MFITIGDLLIKQRCITDDTSYYHHITESAEYAVSISLNQDHNLHTAKEEPTDKCSVQIETRIRNTDNAITKRKRNN